MRRLTAVALLVVLVTPALEGRYLLHCHNLEHDDHSMMARVDVV